MSGMAFRRARAILAVAAVLAGSLPGLRQASASLADQYVCTSGDMTFTVVVNPHEPGSATLCGPLEQAKADEHQHMLLEERNAASGFHYESGGFRFSGHFAHASLHIGSREIPCDMEAEPGA
ncbi:hypothetical protein ACSSV1_003315 [Labrenzia sp. MBR-25]